MASGSVTSQPFRRFAPPPPRTTQRGWRRSPHPTTCPAQHGGADVDVDEGGSDESDVDESENDESVSDENESDVDESEND